MTPVVFANATRSGRREYRADLLVDGRRVGYVERLTEKTLQFRAADYRAKVGGRTVAAERTLVDLRVAIREWWEGEGLAAVEAMREAEAPDIENGAMGPVEREEIETNLRRLASEYHELQAAADATKAAWQTLIRYAVERGLEQTEVAELVGLTRGRVWQILRRAEA